MPDICDDLQGDYPKDFKFTGWHPWCRCYATPILKTQDEIIEDNQRIINGEQVSDKNVNTVEDVPEKFTDWINDNERRLQRYTTLPLFMVENPKYTGIRPRYGTVGTITGTKLGRAATKAAFKSYEDAKPISLSAEQKQNIDDIAKFMGVKVRPMNFIEADEGRSNVNFSKGGVYRYNCQSCVVVHEARLRGLNITALGYEDRDGTLSFELGEHFEQAWINSKTGKIPQLTKIAAKTEKDLFAKLEKQSTPIGRYHIGINYKDGTGHVITDERLHSGDIIFYDAQSGEFVNIKEFVCIDYIELLKIDKLLINKEILMGISEVIK